MPQPQPSALRSPGRDPGDGRVLLAAARIGPAPDAGSPVAVLVTGRGDAAAVVRACRTVLPGARVLFHGDDLGDCVAAAAAGAEVRHCPGTGRDASVRRLFAETDADVYLLVHDAAVADICVAPLALAEIEGGKDFVDIGRFGEAAPRDLADRLLCRAVDFAFGGWGDILHSDLRACSRRFALSYRRTVPGRGGDRASARDLALHALRLRLPIGRVATLADPAGPPAPVPAASVSDRISRAGIALRLLLDERPRRVLGLLGLALVLAGLVVAAPDVKVYRWHATITPGAPMLTTVALLAAGGLAGAAGLLLDALASARQEVRRLGIAATPRRAGRTPPAAAVTEPRARHATSA